MRLALIECVGYLNLMTHQRETIVVVDKEFRGRTVSLTNLAGDEVFASIKDLDADEWPTRRDEQQSWLEYIEQETVRRRVTQRRGHWSNYVTGCVVAVRFAFGRDRVTTGLRGVVASKQAGRGRQRQA